MVSVSLFHGVVGVAEAAGQCTDGWSGMDPGFPRDYSETLHVAVWPVFAHQTMCTRWCCNTLSWSRFSQRMLVNLGWTSQHQIAQADIALPVPPTFSRNMLRSYLKFRPVDGYNTQEMGTNFSVLCLLWNFRIFPLAIISVWVYIFTKMWKFSVAFTSTLLSMTYWMHNISAIFWLVGGFIFHGKHPSLPRCCLTQSFYHITIHLLIYCLVYLLPGVSTTRCLSCLCGHVIFTVNISLVDLGLCLRGYKCGRECDRMCECVNSTAKVNTCIYNRSNPRESWPRFSLLACHLPLKIIYTAFLQLLYSLIMRSRVMCFFLNSREATKYLRKV